MTPIFDVNKITAYHEAGHAVGAFCFGLNVDKVSIIPDDAHLGCTLYDKTKGEVITELCVRDCCGPAAELKYSGMWNQNSTMRDILSTPSILSKVLDRSPQPYSRDDLKKLMDDSLDTAIEIMDIPEIWDDVVSLAEELYIKKTIVFDQ